jgi:hypothetical protein
VRLGGKLNLISKNILGGVKMSKFKKYEFRDSRARTPYSSNLDFRILLIHTYGHSRTFLKQGTKYIKHIIPNQSSPNQHESPLFSDILDHIDLLPDNMRQIYHQIQEPEETLQNNILKESDRDIKKNACKLSVSSFTDNVPLHRMFKYIKYSYRVSNAKRLETFINHYRGRSLQKKAQKGKIEECLREITKKKLLAKNLFSLRPTLKCNPKNAFLVREYLATSKRDLFPTVFHFTCFNDSSLKIYEKVLKLISSPRILKEISLNFGEIKTDAVILEKSWIALKQFTQLESLSITIKSYFSSSSSSNSALYQIMKNLPLFGILKKLELYISSPDQCSDELTNAIEYSLSRLVSLEKVNLTCINTNLFTTAKKENNSAPPDYEPSGMIEEVKFSPKKKITVTTSPYKRFNLREAYFKVDDFQIWTKIVNQIRLYHNLECISISFPENGSFQKLVELLRGLHQFKKLNKFHLDLGGVSGICDSILDSICDHIILIPGLSLVGLNLEHTSISEESIERLCYTFSEKLESKLEEVTLDLRGCDISMEDISKFYAILPIVTIFHNLEELDFMLAG